MAAVAREPDRTHRGAAPRLRVVPARAERDSSRRVRTPADATASRASAHAMTSSAVYHRRQAMVAVVALAVAVAVVVTVAGTGQSSDSAPAAPAVVVVEAGDTLWDLALPHVPAGVHPTAFMARVAADNDVDPRHLEPGTVLRLPAG